MFNVGSSRILKYVSFSIWLSVSDMPSDSGRKGISPIIAHSCGYRKVFRFFRENDHIIFAETIIYPYNKHIIFWFLGSTGIITNQFQKCNSYFLFFSLFISDFLHIFHGESAEYFSVVLCFCVFWNQYFLVFSAYLSIILFAKINIHICHFFIFQIQTLNF